MYRKAFIAGFTLLGMAGVLGGCARRGTAPPVQQAAAPATAVAVVSARTGDIPFTISVTGSLQTLDDVMVSAKVPGKIAKVFVREGDTVQAGQLVVQLETDDLEAQLRQAEATLRSARARLQQAQTALELQPTQNETNLRQAEAALEAARARLRALEAGARRQERKQVEEQVASAKANLDNAQANLERVRRLYQQDAVPKQQLDAAQTAYDIALAQYRTAQEQLSLVQEGARQEDIEAQRALVKQAEEAVRLAQTGNLQLRVRQDEVNAAKALVAQAEAGLFYAREQYEAAFVRSPIGGTVAMRAAQPGQVTGAGTPLLRIVNLNTIFFEARVSETEVRYVRQGQQVTVTVDAYPGKSFVGTVSRIYPVGSEGSRDFVVRVDMRNEGGMLKPQMFARGEILVDVRRNVVLIPKDAVLVQDGKQVVFVVKEGVARRVAVQTGYINGTNAEVRGVPAGAQVVVQGQENLRDGDKVRVEQLQTAEATTAGGS
ncbi:MAG: efflux RND transporter periplasmic adaptor subunit [Armatimonadota bacterium]|nr:efflux RND transporter periplasmic adaptor subunit [bacterium]MDW8320282.1 efflux RND transporter periplasmic adaptor subunit [Armatimonadota bacterium]